MVEVRLDQRKPQLIHVHSQAVEVSHVVNMMEQSTERYGESVKLGPTRLHIPLFNTQPWPSVIWYGFGEGSPRTLMKVGRLCVRDALEVRYRLTFQALTADKRNDDDR